MHKDQQSATLEFINIHHASMLIADLARSLVFYCEVLGLEINPARPDLGYPGAWLNVGPQQIHLLQLADTDKDSTTTVHGGRDRHVAFLINDLSLLQQRLDRAKIDYTLSRSGRKALFCRDPDGNALELIQQ